MRRRLLTARAFLPNRERLRGQPLSPRETDVLRLVATGMPDKLVAATLGIGLRTVKTHTHAAYRKLGVANRTEAALRMIDREQRGRIQPFYPQ